VPGIRSATSVGKIFFLWILDARAVALIGQISPTFTDGFLLQVAAKIDVSPETCSATIRHSASIFTQRSWRNARWASRVAVGSCGYQLPKDAGWLRAFFCRMGGQSVSFRSSGPKNVVRRCETL
jgi:hypothetical protein